MKNCEHDELWTQIARFVKYNSDNIRDNPCIKISEFKKDLYQYQCLTMFTMLRFMLDKQKNEIINAKELEMRKICLYSIWWFSFI